MDYLLSLLIWLPILAGITVITFGNNRVYIVKWFSLILSIIILLLSIQLWLNFDSSTSLMQFVENYVWIEKFNINYHIGIDGISMPLIILTTISIFITILASWDNIKNKVA